MPFPTLCRILPNTVTAMVQLWPYLFALASLEYMLTIQLDQHFLSIYYVPDTKLHTGTAMVTNNEQTLALVDLQSGGKQTFIKQSR